MLDVLGKFGHLDFIGFYAFRTGRTGKGGRAPLLRMERSSDAMSATWSASWTKNWMNRFDCERQNATKTPAPFDLSWR
jgi:hypothetical protein